MQRFEASDGVGIAWRVVNAEAGGVPVVLHHGFGANAEVNWVAPGIVDALVAAGRRVLLLDARGHGAADKPHDSAFYGESRMAQDLSELMDRLRFDSYDLVGYSMGAIVALLCATRDPRIRRLAVGGVGEGILECGGVDTRAIDNTKLAAALLSEDPSDGGPAATAFRAMADALGADREALAAQARALHAAPIPLDRISAPTLVLAGDRDPLAREPQRLADAIPGARLQRVRGDHFAAVGDPAFGRSLVEFLG